MSRMSDIEEKFDLKNWPHRFTKKGDSIQIGELKDDSGRAYDPIFAQPMVCVDCHIEFLSGKDNRPPDPCPARNKKREMKRLLN